MKVSVIIPAYNEEKNIEKCLKSVLRQDYKKLEIIVVDDCSTDGTRELLIKIEGIALLLHEKNRGKGAAVRTALRKVSGDIVVIQDADVEYPPEQYPEVIKPILDGYAVVVFGSVEPWHIIVFVLAVGASWAITDPAKLSLLPNIVPRGSLINAMALNSMASSSSRLVLPALAGVLIAVIGGGHTLALVWPYSWVHRSLR